MVHEHPDCSFLMTISEFVIFHQLIGHESMAKLLLNSINLSSVLIKLDSNGFKQLKTYDENTVNNTLLSKTFGYKIRLADK